MSYIKVSPTFTGLPGLRPLKALTGDLAKALVSKKVDQYFFSRGNEILVSNHLNKCLDLEAGNSQHVQVASAASLNKGTNDTALECWVKIPVGAGALLILTRYASDTGEKLYTNSGGQLLYLIGDGTDTYIAVGTTDIRDDKWHHVFAYADRDSEVYIYLDGTDDTQSRTGTLADVGSLDNTEIFYIGSDGSSYSTIEIDEVRSWVWTGGIPATIATAIAENIRCPYKLSGLLSTSDLKLWLKFDEDSGSTFEDSSPNNNDGTPYSGGGSTTCSTIQALNYLVSPIVYENAVPHAGTLAFRMKCFWDADDNMDHYFFYWYYDADNYIRLEKNSSNNLVFRIKAGGTEQTCTVNVATLWDTGNWYDVVCVWNLHTKFDGTNYIKIYVDQTNTNANTNAQGRFESVESYFQFGFGATAIMTIHFDDVPWFDTIANAEAAYFSQQKSVEYWHNSGNFNLPLVDQQTLSCLASELSSNNKPQSLCSVFHVPLYEDTETTDSTNHKKARVTANVKQFYVGQRLLIGVPLRYSNESTWSDWWETVLIDTGGITDNGDGTVTLTFTAALDASKRTNYTTANKCMISNNLLFDGNFEQYGVKAFEVSNADILKDQQTVFSGRQSLRVRATAAGGYAYTNDITVVAGENYLFSAHFKNDSGNTVKVIIYDNTNSANILDTGYLDRTAFNNFETSFEIPATCTQLQIRLYSSDDTESANYDQLTLLMNPVDNGGFEGTYTANLAPGWTSNGSPTLLESSDEHTGEKAQSVNGDSSNYVYQDVTVESGKWYTFTGYCKGTACVIDLSGATTKTLTSTYDTGYRKLGYTFKAASTTLTIKLYGNGAACLFDDFAVQLLTIKEANTSTPSPLVSNYETDKWGNSNRAFSLHGGSTIKYASTGVLNTDLGTIVILFKTPFAYNQFDNRDFYLFEIENVFKIWYDASEAKFKFQIYDGSSWTTASSQAQTFAAGVWLYIFCLYNNTSGINIYVNNTEGGVVSDTWTAQNLPTYIFFWSDKDGGQQPDAVVDYPHGFDEYLTKTQIAAIVAGDFGDK